MLPPQISDGFANPFRMFGIGFEGGLDW